MTGPIKKIAIVGATGNVGAAFVEALLGNGVHTITALTRASSKATLPEGVVRQEVDYDSDASIEAALQGQEFLIITLATNVPETVHERIVAAAGRAGVRWIMPNAYGLDVANPKLTSEGLYGAGAAAKARAVEAAGASWVVLACGYWYEWSLGLGEPWFGFSIPERKVTFFDDGKQRITTATWEQCGRALAALLALREDGAELSLSHWRNKPLYGTSFTLNQEEMLESLHRVLGTTEADWTITREPTAQRIADGKAQLAKGDMSGFAKMLYGTSFSSEGFDLTDKTENKLLGLPHEDVDAATQRTVKMVENGWNPFVGV